MYRLLVLVLVVFAIELLSVDSCSEGDLVNNITDGFKSGSAINKDNVRYESKNYYHEENTIWGCVCEVTKCLRKCCEDGYHPVKVGTDRVCKPSQSNQHVLKTLLGENEHTKDYKLFHAGFICNTPNSLALNKTDLEKDLNSGSLNAYGMSLDVKNFCLDYNTVHNRLTSIICVVTEEELVFTSIGKMTCVGLTQVEERHLLLLLEGDISHISSENSDEEADVGEKGISLQKGSNLL